MEGPPADIVKRDSTVKEIRQWIKKTKPTADIEPSSFLLKLEQLPPMGMLSPRAHASVLNANVTTGCAMENGGRTVGRDTAAAEGIEGSRVRFASTVTYHEPITDYLESFRTRVLITPTT